MTKDTTMLVATVRNEGANILEWVAHHRLCGFDRIQIYHNDSDDNTLRSLRTLARLGVIELFQNRGLEPGAHRRKSYRRASRSPAYAESAWCMVLDCDEFLHIKTGNGTVQDLIAACPDDADAILMNWRIFGSNGHRELSGELVTERFTRAEPADDIAKGRKSPVKSLARTSAFGRPGGHVPRDPKKDAPICYNGSGQPIAFLPKNWRTEDPEARKLAQVNHYAVRDLSSFLVKHALHAEIGRETGLTYWQKHDRNDETDLSLAAGAFALWSEMKRLDVMSEGKLLRLRQRGIKQCRDKLEALEEQENIQALQKSILAETTPPLSQKFKLPNPQPVFASVRGQVPEPVPEPTVHKAALG